MITITHAYDHLYRLTSSTANTILSSTDRLGLDRLPAELLSYILQDGGSARTGAQPSTSDVHNVKRGFSTDINTQGIYSHNQTVAIQATACTLAGISLIGSLITCYWFSKMRKKFRHKLIIILIIADLIRSTWLFIFPLVSLIHGQIKTESGLCQAGGFFIQIGVELADFAILVIAIHTAMQVFKPVVGHQKRRAETGLYRYRHLVYTLAVILPPTMCALVFIRGGNGYLSQGPTCSLPLRPFWYRLAISWIPRYIVLSIVAGLYLAIYIHVRGQYGRVGFLRRRYKKEKPYNSITTDSTSTQSATQMDGVDEEYHFGQSTPARHVRTISLDPTSPTSVRSDDSSRRVSDGTTVAGTPFPGSFIFGKADVTIGNWSRNSSLPITDLDGNPEPRRKFSSIPSSTIAAIPNTIDENSPAQHESPPNELTKSQTPDIVGKQIVTEQMRAKENAITHQLRLLFAYPVCYFAIWLIPLVQHSLNYDNYLVQHPIFVISILAFASLSAMGAVDSLVFSLREKPWRHITGSDGTFIGSFMFWRHDPNRRESHETDTTELTSRDLSLTTARTVSTMPPTRPPMAHKESYQSTHSSQSPFKYSISSDRFMIDDSVDVRRDMDLSDPFRGGCRKMSMFTTDVEIGGPVVARPADGVESNDFAAAPAPGGPKKMSMPPVDEVDRELYFIDRKMAAALLRQQR